MKTLAVSKKRQEQISFDVGHLHRVVMTIADCSALTNWGQSSKVFWQRVQFVFKL